jgi:hypothetical protein
VEFGVVVVVVCPLPVVEQIYVIFPLENKSILFLYYLFILFIIYHYLSYFYIQSLCQLMLMHLDIFLFHHILHLVYY